MILVALLACRNKDYIVDSAPLEEAEIDDDGDGFLVDDDCDDSNPAVHPDADEVCNGIDDDCDDDIDEDATDATSWYGDADSDGWSAGDPTLACEAPDGHVDQDGDCDDEDAAWHPGADEDDCSDPNDYNCDGSVGYADADGDGWAACEDCDDGDAAVNPDATEVCDDIDNDCDGEWDEDDAADASTFYADEDGDGYGDPDATTVACDQPESTVEDSTDCDDTSADTHPGADEYCDGVDTDCDGTLDEDDALDANTWYADSDSDGFGDASTSTVTCDQPTGMVEDDTDCDDTDADVNPGATETCNDKDDDCDASIDEGVETTYYADSDSDGFGDASTTADDCSTPSGYVEDDTDCDDTDADVNPDAIELCDGIDNDCDGDTDPDDSWWDESWDYRVPVTVTASSYDVDGPPVLVEVDFAAHLSTLGDSGTFSEDSLRVVLQDCSLGLPELPSQFLDDIAGLEDASDHSDASSDGYGTVAFLYDEDGDLSSLETLAGGDSFDVALYFGTRGSATSYSTSLSASTTTLSNSLTSVAFSSSEGGLVDTLTYGGTSVTSQTNSCCGNGIYSNATWTNTPMYATGTNAVDASGDLLSLVSATGSLTDYDYTYWYWMWAARPELWVKTVHEATGSLSMDHATSWTSGVRPWESRQDNISSGATFTSDTSGLYADVTNSGATLGVSFAYVIEPAYSIELSNYDPYIISIGNDYSSSSGGSTTAASGSVLIDHPVMVVMPHSGAFTSSQDELFGLVEGVTTSEGSPETP